jgi:hypothetical protein
MPDEIQHDGCWNCGTLDEPVLKSHTVYNVTGRKGEAKLPESVATCSQPECVAIDKIDYRERGKR